MKISPYTSYLKMQPNALLISTKFYYLQKVGVTQWSPVHGGPGWHGLQTRGLGPRGFL
jgi:hypothetical protein